MIRNPLLAALPCGRVAGVPFRVSILAIVVFFAAIFSFEPAPRPPKATGQGTTVQRETTAKPVTESAVTDSATTANTTTAPAQTASEPVVVTSDTANAPGSEPAPPASDPSTQKTASSESPASTKTLPRPTQPDSTNATPSTANRLSLGLFIGLVLLGSTAIHEIGELLIAHRAGAAVRAIILLPAGGTTLLRSNNPSVQMVVAAIGPVIHLGLCLLCLPVVITSGETAAFSLFSFPAISLTDHWFADAGIVIFSINWKLFWLNMLPFPPLDGAQLIRAWRASSSETGSEGVMAAAMWARWGLVGGLFLIGSGLMLDSVWLLALAGVLLAWACVDMLLVGDGSHADESSLGYDFSQGYTSLEADDNEPAIPRERTLGPIARWRARKDAQKRQREREDRAWAEQELDRLLDKVSKVGMDGLTADEKKTLQQVSSRFKQ